MPGYELMGEEELRAVQELFKANGGVLFAHGFDGVRKGVFKVREFEKAFAAKVGVPHAQAVSSGTAAVYVALQALGIRRGDEVLIPAWTFVATCEAVMTLGAQPVVVEVDDSLNMDPEDLARKISPRAKAVVPVHMMGASADMDAILELARGKGLKVMEDTAQALGASYKGRLCGTLADAGSYSFDFGKMLTTGEGGMVVTRDESVFRWAREYHDHGHEYDLSRPRGEDTRRTWGFNFRMMEIQGAIGVVQLGKLDRILERQRENKRVFKAALSRLIPGARFRRLHDESGDASDTLVLILDRREEAMAAAAALKKEGLGTKLMPEAIDWHFAGTWAHMLCETPLYKGKDLEAEFRRSGDLLRRCLAFGVSVKWTAEEAERIAGKVAAAVERSRAAGGVA